MQKQKDHQFYKITQNLILSNKKDQVLILKHRTGKWLLPGGRMNKGENWLEGLQRELLEEAGIDRFNLTGIARVDTWVGDDSPHYGVFFLGETSETNVFPQNEMIGYAWISKDDDLDGYEFWFEPLKDIIVKIMKKQSVLL